MLKKTYLDKLSNRKVKVVDLSTSNTVAAGSEVIMEVKPPENKVWKLIAVHIEIPPVSGATTGTHRVILTTSYKKWVNFVKIENNYDQPIKLWGYYVEYGTTPMSDTVLVASLQNMVTSSQGRMYIHYQNFTDGDQTETRYQIFIFEEYEEIL